MYKRKARRTVDKENIGKIVNKNQYNFKQTSEILGCIVAIIAILSVVITAILKYISFGRCLYFDFDLNYYDFSLSNIDTFMFLLALGSGIVASLLYVGIYLSNIKVAMFIKNKSYEKIAKYIGVIFEVIAIFIGVMILSWFLCPEKNIATFFSFFIYMYLLCLFAWTNNIQVIIKKKNWVKNGLIVILILMTAFVPAMMKIKYNEAKEQRKFPIISEWKDDNLVNYVVISEGKQYYSTYLCELTNLDGIDILNIATEKHKYFDINNTQTVLVEFDEIKKITAKALNINQYKAWEEEYNSGDKTLLNNY